MWRDASTTEFGAPLRGDSAYGGAGAVPAVALRRILPEELLPRRLRDRRPLQHGVDRLREPALRVRVVGGEHQRVLADRLDGVAQGLLALVELDALVVLRAADVLARLPLERRQRVLAHLGLLVEPRGPEGQPAVAALERGDPQLGVAVQHTGADERGHVPLGVPHVTGRAL